MDIEKKNREGFGETHIIYYICKEFAMKEDSNIRQQL